MRLAAIVLALSASLSAIDVEPVEKNTVDVEVFVLGLSHHTNRSVDWNETNPGLAVGLAYYQAYNVYTTFTAGSYTDSFDERAQFALVGVRKLFGERDDWHSTIGFSFGYFQGSGFNGIGYMPTVSVGYDWFDVCLTGVPFGGGGENNGSRDPKQNRMVGTDSIAVFAKIRLATF